MPETSATPSCVARRNISTDCGFIGEGNSRFTSAGRKIALPFLSALSASKASRASTTPPATSSTMAAALSHSGASVSSSAISPGTSMGSSSPGSISPGSISSMPSCSSAMLDSVAAPKPINPPMSMQATMKISTQVLNSFFSWLTKEWSA